MILSSHTRSRDDRKRVSLAGKQDCDDTLGSNRCWTDILYIGSSLILMPHHFVLIRVWEITLETTVRQHHLHGMGQWSPGHHPSHWT